MEIFYAIIGWTLCVLFAFVGIFAIVIGIIAIIGSTHSDNSKLPDPFDKIFR